MEKTRDNSDHLGDGVYVHFTGFNYEFSVNNHNNPPVVFMEDSEIDALIRFRERIRAAKK